MWINSRNLGWPWGPQCLGTRPSHGRPTPRRRSAVPRLEILEGRPLLSTITVTNPNDANTPGLLSLRQAIERADSENGDVINFDPSLKGKTITLTGGELVLSSTMTIDGGTNNVTVSGNNASRVFDITSGAGKVTLDGLTITGGTAQGAPGVDGWGGGIYEASGATLALNTTSVVGNQAVGGANTASGGIGGAGEGGGLFTEAGSTATITDSQFLNNLALGGAGTYGGHGGGGGINNHGQLTITGTTIADNHSVGGNGVFAGVAIAAGVLNENEAAASGATGPGAVLTLASSTLKGNVATGGASPGSAGGPSAPA